MGMAVAFGYGIAAGLLIVAQTGWPILAVGLASVAAAYLYAGGPKPLGTLGLGEPVVFVFMGPLMVMATYYVQLREVTLASFLVSLPVAFIVTAILHCNNLRDITEDRETGKRSIAGAIGVTPSRWLYAAFLASAYLSIATVTIAGVVSPWALLGLAPLPWAVGAARALFAAEERAAMNRLLVAERQAARLDRPRPGRRALHIGPLRSQGGLLRRPTPPFHPGFPLSRE